MRALVPSVALVVLVACSEEPAAEPAPTEPSAPEAGAAEPPAAEAAAPAVDTEALIRGAQLYGEHCARCHGSIGEGDGPLAMGAQPPPTDLTRPAPGGAEARRQAILAGPREHAFAPVLEASAGGSGIDDLMVYLASIEGTEAASDGPRLGGAGMGSGATQPGQGMRLGPGLAPPKR